MVSGQIVLCVHTANSCINNVNKPGVFNRSGKKGVKVVKSGKMCLFLLKP